ncbi:hypothetical protein PMAYCL1PPCAC_07520 [Pristionchus mayeri]|uniref:GYF domain-containing protein n=1 Tax=Pristionchus mayeri TaxID=1317129 RepID=A0AAN5CAZ5_9BILA|nr:hypothetical protein PMAYCL1PPCAC_07520 [Pristionchus mayeri]
MEFFYTGEDGTEQGPFSERLMTDWVREYQFSKDQKIRFYLNGREYKTTLERMRTKNGNCTPFIFTKCERVDKEKQLRKEIEEASLSTEKIGAMMDDLRKNIAKTSLDSRQLMERMQRKIDAMKEETGENNGDDEPAYTKVLPPAKNRDSKASTSNTPKRVLPLYDVSSLKDEETDIGDDRESIKLFRSILDDVDLDAAQDSLKLPVPEKCRVCGTLLSEGTLRSWLCHITSKNHIEKFRQKGGRVTLQCIDWYSTQLEQFPRKRETSMRGVGKGGEEKQEEETVDLQKKKLECYMGVIMLPLHVPLLHVDPSDTTKLSSLRGREEMKKLRDLIYGQTDRYSAAKSLFLPRTTCEVCNLKFDFTPHIVPHFLSNDHINKYLEMRGSFSQHDFDFWTEICRLFPEAGKDSRDQREVRAQLRSMGKILDISTCKDSLHYSIYGGENRMRHIVDFVKKQLVEHKRPVVVYVRSEEMGNEVMEHIQEQLADSRIGWVNSTEECHQLEVMVTDISLRLTRPHAIAFPSAPLEPVKKAEYAQKMCADHVEANMIIAFGVDESSELRKLSRRVTVPANSAAPPHSEPPTATTMMATDPVSLQTSSSTPPLLEILPSWTSLRVNSPVHSVSPLNSQLQKDAHSSSTYPTVPPNQRRYDPYQASESPKSVGESKKCAMM